MKVLHEAAYQRVGGLLRDLAQLAIEKHSRLNLVNPALANALILIQLSGKNIDGDTVRKINVQLTGDIPALKALKQIYKNTCVLYDGGLYQQIYKPEAQFEKLAEWNYHAFMQKGGSLNSLASIISKIAKLDGLDFP